MTGTKAHEACRLRLNFRHMKKSLLLHLRNNSQSHVENQGTNADLHPGEKEKMNVRTQLQEQVNLLVIEEYEGQCLD